ncbi:energy-coupling factor ABC transporter ATP-binding protein [Adlercreutzia sp. ZJ141]|uniref:energy-coupling factor ABC transporter ATP-binding protein n=1 Tax=Adlercreutzia sp. ZJ141 TaxID=2709406 RepID=UPI00197EA536|nr:ABC transporter ATP-binding protein [Adlercreutzia sp. ZJ141]
MSLFEKKAAPAVRTQVAEESVESSCSLAGVCAPSIEGADQKPVIEFSDVHFGYAEAEVLRGISFRIQPGEFVAVLGPNGTGKSTILRLADGLLAPASGHVRVCGLDTAEAKVSDIARHVGFLFQNPDRQICQNTVYDEVLFGLRALQCGTAEQQKARADEVLELLHLDGDADPFNLSRGQRQAVALAGLIAVDPCVLLLDEPTTGFDYSECMEMMTHIKRMNEAGATVVMVCHDMEVVLDFASRAIVLAEGRVLLDGTPRDVFSERDTLQRASLIPPQICELSTQLAKDYPQLGGKFCADELASAIATLAGGEAVASSGETFECKAGE